MTSRARLSLCLLLVAVVYVFHVDLKLTKISANPTWNATDEVGQFWSEFAFHYRFAKFFAEHPVSDWGQLTRDRHVQYPDTIDDWAEFTVAMEVPVGVLYRWLRPATPFHVFVVWYDCLVSSLTLFAVFFLARALWRSDWAGVLASLFYAALYPSYGRTVKNLFLREDFAIPLIVFALFFTMRAIQEQKIRDQVVAALIWLAALASWHLTQFVLAVGVGAAVLVYLGKGETPRVPWFVVILAAGSVLIPVLWAKQLYLSPVLCALYALSLAVWINGGRKRATLVFAGWLTVLVAASFLLRKSYGEYAHVYQLFYYKLRYFGVKPDEPARLPWEARCLWEGAFNTASAAQGLQYLGYFRRAIGGKHP
jgi:asparagine N-glycosylation enzyme membrane subunit Stt3